MSDESEQAGSPDQPYTVGPGKPPKEYQWKPGQSGNPGGRAKGRSITAALREALEREHNGKTLAVIVAEALIKGAAQGKVEHIKELLNRVDGKVTDTHELAAPVQVVHKVVVGTCWEQA